jgi:DNA (cytosine-5)-methyltransferase 1
LNELALFAGVGGGILGGFLNGKSVRSRIVCAVEIDDYCRDVLMQRQDDGMLEPFPIFDDIRTFNGKPWAGCVDCVTGGFPCQDISTAGRGDGIDGKQSGLWSEMARVIREVRPRFCFVENSPMLTVRGLGRILGDLAEMGFNARWGVLGADDVGAFHIRKRIWILADSTRQRARAEEQSRRPRSALAGGEVVPDADRHSIRHEQQRLASRWADGVCNEGSAFAGDDGAHGSVADANGAGCERPRQAQPAGWIGAVEPIGSSADVPSELCDGARIRSQAGSQGPEFGDPRRWRVPAWTSRWPPEPNVGRVAHGVPHRVDRVKALGNAQVPGVAALAWRILKG